MAFPRKYYTFEQLVERWSDHGVTVHDIVHWCRDDELIPSVRLEEQNVLAITNTGKDEYQAVGNCYISGVFDASRNHVFDYLAQPDIYWLYPTSLEFKIVSWSDRDKPRDLTGDLSKLPRWVPQQYDSCRNELTSFYAIPRQIISYLGVPTDIHVLPMSEFRGLQQELKHNNQADDYVDTIPQSALEVVILTDRIAEFEQAGLPRNENAGKPNSDSNQQTISRPQQREEVLLKYLNKSNYLKGSKGLLRITDQSKLELWNALGLYSSDMILFPVRDKTDSSVKKFFRVQNLCYWKD